MHAIPVAFYGKIATFSDFKKNRDFSWNTHLFFIKIRKISILNISKTLAIPVALYGNFSSFRHFLKRQDFFWKNQLSFEKKPQISNVLRILPIESHSLAYLLLLAIFKKLKSFVERHI